MSGLVLEFCGEDLRLATTVAVANREERLFPREAKLLLILAAAHGRVVTRAHLLEHVWGYSSLVRTRTVDCHVARLRRKLGAKIIKTVRGGYRMDAKLALQIAVLP